MLLTENRVSQVKEKYDIPSEVWEPMVSGSAAISPNQKYLEWIAKTWKDYVSTQERIETQDQEGWMWTGTLNGLLTTIEEFDRVRPNLKKKDLYQYKDRKEVVDSLEQYKKEKVRNIGTHKESEVVYEDDRFKVVVPKSHTASCYYGAGTKWCTASTDNPGHFTNYDRDGKLFYILDKQASTSNPFYKIALNKTYKGSTTWYDAKDDVMTAMGNADEYIDELEGIGMLNKIDEYFKFTYKDEIEKISEEEKQKELERIAREAKWARRRREREQRLEQNSTERRENDEWELGETGTVGTMAHALMEWLIDEGEWNDMKSEIADIQSQIEDMMSAMQNDPEVIEDPNGERAQDYGSDLNNLYEEIDVLKGEANDVYDIRYEEFEHYGLPAFEYDGAEYAVGDDDMADSAAYDQIDNLIDDIGYQGFSEGFMEYYVDGDLVAEDFEDMFQNDMEDNPEDFLDDDDMELSDYSKEQLEAMDDQIGEHRFELDDTSNESDREYLVGQIEALEEAKEETLEDEDNYEYTEDAKDNYVRGRMGEVRDDPVAFLQDYGYGTDTWDRYIDRDRFIEGVISSDGRGNGLSGYDGVENEVSLGDGWYYIYRTN